MEMRQVRKKTLGSREMIRSICWKSDLPLKTVQTWYMFFRLELLYRVFISIQKNEPFVLKGVGTFRSIPQKKRRKNRSTGKRETVIVNTIEFEADPAFYTPD